MPRDLKRILVIGIVVAIAVPMISLVAIAMTAGSRASLLLSRPHRQWRRPLYLVRPSPYLDVAGGVADWLAEPELAPFGLAGAVDPVVFEFELVFIASNTDMP